MGRYDNRTGCEANLIRWNMHDLEDGAILHWWDQRHVEALRKCIRDFQWAWPFRCSGYVRAELPDEQLLAWCRKDPRVRHRYEDPRADEAESLWAGGAEVLVSGFSWAYGHAHGLVDAIRPSRSVTCGYCGQNFEEHSLPPNFIERLGVEQIDICSPCLRDTLMRFSAGKGDNGAPKEEIKDFISRLTCVINRIPPSSFGYDEMGALWGLTTAERAEVLELLTHRPSRMRITELYGSWLAALIDAGVLEGGAHRTLRGIRSIASDGHVCLSLGERTICELLVQADIAHEKEVLYPEGRFRADYRIGHTLLEYVGLAGDSEYDARTRAKQDVAARHGIRLELITSTELADQRAFVRRIQRIAKHHNAGAAARAGL
jgi:hypothetical protein